MQRRQAGFTFIEILVVMGIIVVLMGMVAVIVPRAQEAARRTQCTNNVRQLATTYAERAVQKNKWPLFDGKRFILATVANGWVDSTERDNVEVFFCPGDTTYSLDLVNLERYKDLKADNLSNVDVHELTSYAGRRNQDTDYRITPARLKSGAAILCDDDDGALHHTDGLVIGYTDGRAKFVEWTELGMPEPEDENDPKPFLADEASVEKLKGLSSD